MQVFLGAKKFSIHLDNLITPPDKPQPLAAGAKEEEKKEYEKKSETYTEWVQEDTEARHYIFSTIPDSLLIKVINCQTVKDLWAVICKEHKDKTKVFRMEMIHRLHNKCCTDVDNVRIHFAKMVRLHEELAAISETLTEDNFTSILTNSLPESYGNVISTAYTTATMYSQTPTTQQIIAVVKSKFSRHQISSGGIPASSSSTALFTNPQGPSASKWGKKKKPNHCTNIKCKYQHMHDFKDCRSEGGPQHASNPLPICSPLNQNTGQNKTQQQNNPGGRNT